MNDVRFTDLINVEVGMDGNSLTKMKNETCLVEYVYDAGGQRVKKTKNGSETCYFFKNYEEVIESGSTKKIFHYFTNGRRIAQRWLRPLPNQERQEMICILQFITIYPGSSQRKYYQVENLGIIPRFSPRVAQRIITGTDNELLYIHSDHLGSSVKLTDETGETVQVIVYDPYGKTVYSGGVNEIAYQFTGQELIQGTGLYYYGARYYDPVLGRFISPDPVLAGLNRYAYCYNNPVMYIDPSGNNPVVNFFIYSALYLTGAYLSGVSSSGGFYSMFF